MGKGRTHRKKEWKIRGYSLENSKKIDEKLMNDQFSYWFRYRSIPWYRKRKIKGTSPRDTIFLVLDELELTGDVTREKKERHTSYHWLIESK